MNKILTASDKFNSYKNRSNVRNLIKSISERALGRDSVQPDKLKATYQNDNSGLPIQTSALSLNSEVDLISSSVFGNADYTESFTVS